MFILVFKGLVEAQTALSLWRPGPDPMSVLGEIWRKWQWDGFPLPLTYLPTYSMVQSPS